MTYWWTHLSFSQGALAMLLAAFSIGILCALVKRERKARNRITAARLGSSPFFRNIYDPHYRAGKLQ